MSAHEGSPTLEQLLTAPEEVVIDDRRYVLETYLWRNFMNLPHGGPLIALINLTVTDGLTFPRDTDADRLWVISGQEVWETGFTSETETQPPWRKHQWARIARGGPEWGPHVKVDVVVQVTNGRNRTSLLRAPGQVINHVA